MNLVGSKGFRWAIEDARGWFARNESNIHPTYAVAVELQVAGATSVVGFGFMPMNAGRYLPRDDLGLPLGEDPSLRCADAGDVPDCLDIPERCFQGLRVHRDAAVAQQHLLLVGIEPSDQHAADELEPRSLNASNSAAGAAVEGGRGHRTE
ncbi:MAG: hypothetical protein LH645_06515 [Actinomycetia bacterium]|nr:hypothetical protein [Actinomycetes bacterium]